MKLKKFQNGGETDFWGLNNNNYTNNYKSAVENILNNQTTYKRITSDLLKKGINISDNQSFKKLAFDKKIGPVHNSIVEYGKSLNTTNFPKDIVKYKYTPTGGYNKSTSQQIINTHKNEFDELLDVNKNDSAKAYLEFSKKYPSLQKIGSYSENKKGTTYPIYKQMKGGLLIK